MNKKPLTALLLAGALTATAAPAAALTPMDAALAFTGIAAGKALGKHESKLTPPAQDGQTISFAAIERTVRAHNPQVKSLEKMVSSVESQDVSSQFFMQRLDISNTMAGMEAQAQYYEAEAKKLEDQIDDGSGAAGALKAMANNMRAQAASFRMQANGYAQSLSGLDEAEKDAETSIADAAFAVKKQAEYAGNQLVQGAQSMYTGLCSLQENLDSLDRGLAALDRSLPVVQKQVEIGMAASMDLLRLQNQRAQLASTRATLVQQITVLENTLSLTLGNDAGKTVHAGAMPAVSDRDLRAMNYTADLETALKNSYTLWQKEDEVRKASNDYEKNVTSTVDAYKSAQIARDAQREQIKTDLRKLFEDVSEKQRLVKAAEADLTLAEASFRVAEVKHTQGLLSALEFAAAQDDLETARQAVQTAKNTLFTAYQAYDWARKGVI